MTLSPLANGYILGWSVAWPPGPINAEMIRRGLLPKDRGGGFWSAWPIGLGACTGDFIWAFGVSVGAGALLNSVEIRRVLAIVSLALLFFLAVRFAIGAWKIYRARRSVEFQAPKSERRGGFLFGLFVVLMSPWNVGFWLAVIGSQPAQSASVRQSLAIAVAVVLGALTWGVVLCTALKFGAHIFSHPNWQGRDRSHHRCGYVMVCHSAPAPFSMNPITEPRTAILTINEIYHSIQGESTWAGLPCVFVRLTFCDLRCTYCDTAYAFYEGEKKTLSEITTEVLKFDCPLVEITGGEPLLQKNVLPLMSALADAGKTVLLETSGAHDIARVDRRVHRIMDLKTPGSGECERNLWSNIKHLTARDEVKFVIGSREDYEWSREKMHEHNLSERCHAVLFSPIFGRIEPRQIVEWMLADNLAARFQLQMHKFIWAPTTRGV
jgi:7-carboxy-7-deazaguanine synthase